MPDEKNILQSFDKNINDCTHQIVKDQVYFNAPTLLNLTLQNFNMIGNCLEDTKTHKICTGVKSTDKQEEMVTDDHSVNANSNENQIHMKTGGSITFEQEIIGNKTSISVKDKYTQRIKEKKSYKSTKNRSQDRFLPHKYKIPLKKFGKLHLLILKAIGLQK